MNFDIDPDYVDAPNFTPEKRLILAVLERAIRDLAPEATSFVRRNAISWFRADHTVLEYQEKFTYEFVKEALELSASQIKKIESKVHEADKLQFKLSIRNPMDKNKLLVGFDSNEIPLYM